MSRLTERLERASAELDAAIRDLERRERSWWNRMMDRLGGQRD